MIKLWHTDQGTFQSEVDAHNYSVRCSMHMPPSIIETLTECDFHRLQEGIIHGMQAALKPYLHLLEPRQEPQ